ncbi:MAG: hypothetical protein Unbinned5434contig1000_42 [Prokaryotic dsDNA virus sp.]|jgi:hypothetical protein|nr:MAG: hypothetical protein Unbinned5434contig1000_42 [Prokaryotic dsDNA virus sp.]
MKTINIKGKDYITVNERLKYFRSESTFNGWQINEQLVHIDEKEGIFKVTICDTKGVEIASAHSQEYRDSSYINKTSFVENGFTSALGRALGYLGIGIDTSIASANEVQNAVKNQTNENKKWLTEAQFNATLKAKKEQAEKVLSSFKMKKEYREQIKQKFNI